CAGAADSRRPKSIGTARCVTRPVITKQGCRRHSPGEGRMIPLWPKSPAILSLLEVNALRRTKLAPFGVVFLSLFLVASTAFPRVLHAQASAAGTTIAVKMIDTVDSSKDPAGKQYRASVTKAVDAGNGVTIAQGAFAAVTLANSSNGS